MKERSGLRTTEFWITLAVVIAGLLPSSGLLPEGHWAVKVCGLIVSAAAAMGYTVTRGGVKKSIGNLLLLTMLAGTFSGCCSQGYVKADAIRPAVELVTGLHDRMLLLEKDPKEIKPEDRATYLRTSQLLRETVREAAGQSE